MLENLLKNVQTVAVVCNQYGDTGKGKFSDLLAHEWADVTARGTGGNNAGHTVVVNGREKVFHLIPAGISNDSRGKITILGNGMVIDTKVLCDELDEIETEGGSYNNLMVSRDASVIMPYHVNRDVAKNKSQKGGGIGSTGRGIGPCYADKIARSGVFVKDLFDRTILAKKIDKAKSVYSEQNINTDEVIDLLHPFSERIKPLVRDSISEMHNFYRTGHKILLEGAQGLLLSIEHGISPFVTSSDCSLNGTASGVGLSAKMIDLPLGVIKFPFMTRVGGGPFPTELGGSESELYCADDNHNKLHELKEWGINYTIEEGKVKYNWKDSKIRSMINSQSEFVQGVGLRLAAGEYGATTGRARRTGWTDAVAARYAVGINGPLMILTKLDCVAGAEEFKIGYEHKVNNQWTTNFVRDEKNLREVKVNHRIYDGYGYLDGVRQYQRLPGSLKVAIDDFEKFTGGKVAIVSVGADRNETIVR